MSQRPVPPEYHKLYTLSAWKEYGLLHRKGGPAVIAPLCKGAVEKWYKNGLLHNTKGPAISRYCRCKAEQCPAQLYSDEWWVDGKEYTKYEFRQFVNKMHPLLSSSL